MMKRLDRTEVIFKVLSYVLLTIFAIICIYPLVYVLAVSLSDNAGYGSNRIALLPLISDGNGGVKVGIAKYGKNSNAFTDIFNDKQFWFSYCNTIFYAFYGTLVSMVVGITGAYSLSKTRLMFGRGFNFLLTFTMWFSAGIIATWQNFVKIGIDNKYGFIFGLGFNAFNIILLRNGFKGVPTEIEEAATIDGATEFQILLRVYVPMSKSSIVTVAMFYAVARWNGYIWAQMLLLNSEDILLTVFIKNTMAEMVDQITNGADVAYSVYGLQYAFIVCSIIPVIVIYPSLQKYFAAGVNVGGVKE